MHLLRLPACPSALLIVSEFIAWLDRNARGRNVPWHFRLWWWTFVHSLEFRRMRCDFTRTCYVLWFDRLDAGRRLRSPETGARISEYEEGHLAQIWGEIPRLQGRWLFEILYSGGSVSGNLKQRLIDFWMLRKSRNMGFMRENGLELDSPGLDQCQSWLEVLISKSYILLLRLYNTLLVDSGTWNHEESRQSRLQKTLPFIWGRRNKRT